MNEYQYKYERENSRAPYPRRLEIELTQRCNQDCLHCSSNSNQGCMDLDVSIDNIMTVIEDFSLLGGKEVVLTGGEPLILGDDYVINLIRYIEENGLTSYLYTNASNLSDELASQLGDYENLTVCVSLEGSEETHNNITRICNSYHSTVNSLAVLSKYNVKVRLHFTPMQLNYKDFRHIIELANTYSIPEIKIMILIEQGRAIKEMKTIGLDNDHEKEFIEIFKSETMHFSGKILVGGVLQGLGNSCSTGNKIVITSTGNILPCLGLRNRPDYEVGKIEDISLHDAWHIIRERFQGIGCICSNVLS